MPKGTSGGKRTRSLGGGAIELYNISVRPSSISGQGAFTDHQIRKGNSLGVAFTQVNSTGIPDIDFTSTTLGQYINHSKDPNVKLVHVNNGQYEFQAIKHIRRGQELRADYDQIEKTIGFKGNRDFREITGKVYSAPYTLDEIRSQYGEGIYNRLKEDPIHRWRAETGVELIHKEPTNDELQRIWKNWNLMTNKQKKESDHKSKELFGKTNVEHYNDLSEVTLQNKSHVDLRKQFKNSGINIDNKSVDPKELAHERFVQEEHRKSLRRIEKQLGVKLDIPLEVRDNPSVYTTGETLPETSKYTGGQGSSATQAEKPFSTIGTRQQIIDSMNETLGRVPVKATVEYVTQHENLHHYYQTLSPYQKRKLTQVFEEENLISDYGDRREEKNVDILSNLILPKTSSEYKSMSRIEKQRILKKIIDRV